MPCDLETTMADACTSGIGKLRKRIALLRAWAQLLCGTVDSLVLFKENSATPFIQWAWDGADPDHWSMEGSDDLSAWAEDGTVSGASRQRNGHHTFLYWRLIGQDAGNNPVTAYSNILPDS